VSAPRVVVSLSAVIVAVDRGRPLALTVRHEGAEDALPYGPFDPADHRTFELGLRGWVERQTGLDLGYVEQLYTFGDRGRRAPSARLEEGDAADRVVSVGYLALVRAPEDLDAADAAWRDWYGYFPWEDWRAGRPAALDERVLPLLDDWARRGGSKAETSARTARIDLAFGRGEEGWSEERALERYELMYEAGVPPEAARDRGEPPGVAIGRSMASDHRRILATAISRLRGKLKYRPVIFDLCPETFTITDVQARAEAVCGLLLHKPNFRRMIVKTGLVEETGETTPETGGRPAALYRARAASFGGARPALGLTLPRASLKAD